MPASRKIRIMNIKTLKELKLKYPDAAFICLASNEIAYVDKSDFEFLNTFAWKKTVSKSGNVYAATCVFVKGKQKTIFMHQLVMNSPIGLDTDHINGVGLDNRKCNLRICNRFENMRNLSKMKNTKNKYKGVWKHPSRNGYFTAMNCNGKKVFSKYFKCEIDAALYYDEMAIKYHGEFALTNKMMGLL